MLNRIPLIDRVSAVRRTRALAAQALAKALNGNGSSLSEKALCERWLAEMASDPAVFPEGWYAPPPSGLSALIGNPPEFTRMTYVSLRHKEIWPRQDITLDEESLLYAYASPIDRETKMIGDLGITLYRGTDQRIREHLSVCLQITAQLADYAAVGMEFRELYNHAAELMQAADLSNQTYSMTDSTGGLDVGHTIPWSHCDATDSELALLRSGNPDKIAAAINHGRTFINREEALRIQPSIAFTVEPRMAGSGRPLSSFHVIVTFAEGVKHISADFTPILQAFGMTEYLAADALRTLGCGNA